MYVTEVHSPRNHRCISVETVKLMPLDNIAVTLHHYFAKQDYFRVGTALVILLQQGDMVLSRPQRLVCIFLLYEMYSQDKENANPFNTVFVHLLNPPPEDGIKKYWHVPDLLPPEKFFLCSIINYPSKEIFQNKATEIILKDLSPEEERIDIIDLQLSVVSRLSQMPTSSKMSLGCLLPITEYNKHNICEHLDDESCTCIGKPNKSDQNEQILTTLFLNRWKNKLKTGPKDPKKKPHACKVIRPKLIRPSPGIMPCHNEMVWLSPQSLNPNKKLTVTLDFSMCSNQHNIDAAQKMLTRACQGPLSPHQQTEMGLYLEEDEKMVFNIGLTPEKLPALVENNPLVAIDVLLKLMASSQITDYFAILVNMEMSLHSMEVVNRLTTAVELPSEFIHLYISNCINTCENIEDRYMQNRLVRLVCVFLQSLIRNKIIDINEIFIEVQSFCIEFSRIREAAGLFRLLRTLDTTSSSAGCASGAGPSTSGASTSAQHSQSDPLKESAKQ